MFYYIPTIVYQENNAVVNHSRELASLGKKALIVTGRTSAKKCGALDDVLTALESTGREFAIFDSVEENPSVDTVMRARDLGLREGCDFVIGIGGGSPLDASKAIAYMMYNKEADWEVMYKPTSNRALSLATVPTTCGTGSEVTPYSILTRKDINAKGSIPVKLFPIYALVDSRYLTFAPKQLLGNTAIDALAHLLESYVNSNATDYSRFVAEGGLKIWTKSRDVIVGGREADATDYDNMMLASSIAGMAIAHTGTSIPHGFSYSLTCNQGIAHGMGVGYFQASYLRETDKVSRETLLNIMGLKDVSEIRDIYVAATSPVKLSDEALFMSMEGLLANESKLKCAPFKVDREVLARIANWDR